MTTKDYVKYKKKRINGKTQQLHRVIWERHHGPIPEGCVIHHKDDNTMNNDIDNLEMMTKKEHNQLHTTLIPPPQKRCPRCQKIKDISKDFYRRPRTSAYCRSCTKIKNREDYKKRYGVE